jgi:HD-GYP domain-containing protein (c-di-GMP phosphodiesterase class II)
MMDGNGYPQGLKGDQIPMQARIVSVADTFDAMTTDRPYQKAMKFEDALGLIKKFVGSRYDETVVAALMEACDSGQIAPGRVRLRQPAKPGPNGAKPPAKEQPQSASAT